MSNREAEESAVAIPGIDALEAAVRRLVAETREARQLAADARARADRSDELLRQFVDGRQDPGALSRRITEVEAENAELRRRIERGRERIDQILASIRFLEDRR